MARILVLGSFAESLINFRGPLLKAMAECGHTVVGCAPSASLEIRQNLCAIRISYRDIPLYRAGLNPFRDLSTLCALVALFREVRPDVVFNYTIKPVIYGSLAARWAGVPAIYSMITGAGYAFLGTGIRGYCVGHLSRLLYKWSLGGNRKVFFQNPDDRHLFQNLALLHDANQAVLVNGSGVDIDRFKPAAFPSILAFLLMARLQRDKGVVEFIQAARVIKAQHPDVVFRLAGWIDPSPMAISETDLMQWVKEGVIEYLGNLEDVRPAITHATVYVLPSYREGTPRTVLESMAMGRPIITTDAPGCRETVVDGENGFLVPVKNVDALVHAMKRFILEPELIEKMGRRSREIAEEKYDVHKVNAVIMKTMGLLGEKTV